MDKTYQTAWFGCHYRYICLFGCIGCRSIEHSPQSVSALYRNPTAEQIMLLQRSVFYLKYSRFWDWCRKLLMHKNLNPSIHSYWGPAVYNCNPSNKFQWNLDDNVKISVKEILNYLLQNDVLYGYFTMRQGVRYHRKKCKMWKPKIDSRFDKNIHVKKPFVINCRHAVKSQDIWSQAVDVVCLVYKVFNRHMDN